MKLINHFKKGDFYDQHVDRSEYPVYNRYSRYDQIDKKLLPEKIKLLQEKLNFRNNYINDKRSFDLDMIILGVYPICIFIPIKIDKIDLYHNIYDCVSYLDYSLTKSILDVNKNNPEKDLIDLGIIDENYCRPKYMTFDSSTYGNGLIGPYDNTQHIYYPMVLNDLGFDFDKRFEYFTIDNCNKIFKSLKSPLFVTDLKFCECLCNPQLNNIVLNTYYQEYYDKRSSFVNLSIPKDLKVKLMYNIPDMIEDYLSAADEPEEIKRNNKDIIIANGFDIKTSFRNM